MILLVGLILLTATMIYLANSPRIGGFYRNNKSRTLCYVTIIDYGSITVEYSPSISQTMPLHIFKQEFTRA